MPTIAVIAPGAMGSAVARRLTAHGATVLTSLAGRSAATIARARDAGMQDADDERLAGADVILSIVPPAQAETLAHRLAGPLTRAARKPVFADCNAVNVETVRRIAAIVAPTGCPFVDGAIIGPPPGAGSEPCLYLSGAAAGRLALLGELGLGVRTLEATVGAASALKMVYAGINKGITLLVAAMVLNADRAGVAAALRDEMTRSQSELLRRVGRSIPDMYPKAWRWAPEMEEIAAFVGDDAATGRIYEALAAFCRRMAADEAGERAEIQRLDAFLQRGAAPSPHMPTDS
ncbi:MAG: DUF1932 domain-containing protein [Lautropia sp.]